MLSASLIQLEYAQSIGKALFLTSPPLPPRVPCLLSTLLLLLSCSVCSPLLFPSPGQYLACSHAPLGLCPVLRPVGQLGRPPQVPLRGDSPVVCPHQPPLHQFPDGGAGRPVRFNAGHRHGVSLREASCALVPLLAPCVPLSPRGPVPRVLLLFSPVASPVALVAAHARPACAPRPPLRYPCLAALRPSPPVSPSHPYAPPTRCHSEGRGLPPPVSTFLSTVSAFAVPSPVFVTRGFHLRAILMSLPFPLEPGCTLTLSTLQCYRPQALCYARNPRLSPLPGRHRFTVRESIGMQTRMEPWKRMGKMMGQHP